MAVRITRAGVGLTVGIVILALVVLGGLYIAKERGEQARRDDAIEVAQENLESESETGVLAPSPESENEQSGGSEAANNTTDDADDMPTTGAEVPPEELPQTGPAEQLTALIAIALLSFAAASYVTSRRALAAARQ